MEGCRRVRGCYVNGHWCGICGKIRWVLACKCQGCFIIQQSAKYNGVENYCASRHKSDTLCVSTHRLFLAVVFMRSDVQLQWPGSELVEGGSQLKAVLEQGDPGKDVQTQPGSRHGHHQTPHIPMARGEKLKIGLARLKKQTNRRGRGGGGKYEIKREEIKCRRKIKTEVTGSERKNK